MPEPNTCPHTSADPAAPEGATAEWAAPKMPLVVPEVGPTQTRTLASTPGPERPDRATDSNTQVHRLDFGAVQEFTTQEFPVIPGFRIEAILGLGGMGSVYRALDLTLNKRVALKLIDIRGGDESVVRGRFEREVQTLAALEHPNVVPVYHAGYCDGRPYFTMKYIPGGPLSRNLKRFTGNPLACARLMAKVARGLHHAHEQGVLHRDLKPLNILLGDGDEPLVADFSLAKWLESVIEPVLVAAPLGAARGSDDSRLTATGAVLGTRQYMAPEQTRPDVELSAACDIWALGVTLYELLAGNRPFPDDGHSDLYTRIRECDPPPLPDTVPTELAAVVAKCLAKQPDRRYGSAADVASALEEVVAKATRPSSGSRRRNWLVVTALVGMVALIGLPASFMRGTAPKSLAQRLRGGEKVTMIGAKGMPAGDPMSVPDHEGSLFLGNNGFATLSSAGFAAVELSNEELPWPISLRAEYAVADSQDVRSRAGVYVGRKRFPTDDPCNSLIQLIHTESPPPAGREDTGPTQWAAFETLIWSAKGPEVRMTFPAVQRGAPDGNDANHDLQWQQVEVVISPVLLRGSWNGLELKPLSGPRLPNSRTFTIRGQLDSWVSQWGRMHPEATLPTIAPPEVGPGIGLCVFNATAVFRNITLERSKH